MTNHEKQDKINAVIKEQDELKKHRNPCDENDSLRAVGVNIENIINETGEYSLKANGFEAELSVDGNKVLIPTTENNRVVDGKEDKSKDL